MPTLPLFQIPENRDAWHSVLAPGGYEGWFIKVDDPASRVTLVAMLGAGCSFEAAYRRAYKRYRRRPTIYPPPAPADFLCSELWLFLASREQGSWDVSDGRMLQASTTSLDLQIGEQKLVAQPDGYHLIIASPINQVEGELIFTPKTPLSPVEPITPATVHWIQRQQCAVFGAMTWKGKKLQIDGSGSLTHRIGIEPITKAPPDPPFNARSVASPPPVRGQS